MKRMAWLVLALMALAVSPVSAETVLYGSARFETFYLDGDSGAGGSDTKDFEFDLQGNTHLGGKFATGDVNGVVELGLEDSPNAVSLRLAYGTWNFGSGVLTVGQDYAPFDWAVGQVANEDNDMFGYGALSIDRSPQIKAHFNCGGYVALIKNGNSNVSADDIEWPILAVGYDGKVGETAFGLGTGYATYEKAADRDADTWFVYGQVEQDLDAVTLAAKLYYGQNLAELPGYEVPVATYEASLDKDAKTLAGFIAGTFAVNDGVSVVAGVGYAVTDRDDFAKKDDQITYFVDLPVQVAKGFTVTPSVTVFDFLDAADGTEEGSQLWIGAKWQMDF